MAGQWEAMLRQRKALHVVVGIVALVGIAATLASCGGSGTGAKPGGREAERVAVKWLKEMADSDIKAACRLMDAENHESHPGHPNWSPAKNCQERWLHSNNTPLNWKPKPGVISIWGDSNPKVLEVVVEGDRAIVFVKGIGQRRPVGLRRERGRWLVEEAEYPI